MKYKYVEGWTSPITRTLKKDGAAFNATGLNAPALVMVDIETGERLDTVGDMSWDDATVSKAKFSPDPGDIRPGKFRITMELTESDGTKAYFPNGDAEVWEVRPL
jgi:hypothetical protein